MVEIDSYKLTVESKETVEMAGEELQVDEPATGYGIYCSYFK